VVDFFTLGEEENKTNKLQLEDGMGIGGNVPSYWIRQLKTSLGLESIYLQFRRLILYLNKIASAASSRVLALLRATSASIACLLPSARARSAFASLKLS